jgi:hypothetical protein
MIQGTHPDWVHVQALLRHLKRWAVLTEEQDCTRSFRLWRWVEHFEPTLELHLKLTIWRYLGIGCYPDNKALDDVDVMIALGASVQYNRFAFRKTLEWWHVVAEEEWKERKMGLYTVLLGVCYQRARCIRCDLQQAARYFEMARHGSMYAIASLFLAEMLPGVKRLDAFQDLLEKGVMGAQSRIDKVLNPECNSVHPLDQGLEQSIQDQKENEMPIPTRPPSEEEGDWPRWQKFKKKCGKLFKYLKELGAAQLFTWSTPTTHFPHPTSIR